MCLTTIYQLLKLQEKGYHTGNVMKIVKYVKGSCNNNKITLRLSEIVYNSPPPPAVQLSAISLPVQQSDPPTTSLTASAAGPLHVLCLWWEKQNVIHLFHILKKKIYI